MRKDLLTRSLTLSHFTIVWGAVLCLSLVAAGSPAANFVRVSLTDTNPDAVCNDGSPATYFYRAGTGSGASIWTIYQEGGGWCYDVASCKERQVNTPHFMTSKLLPNVLNDSTVSRDVNHGGINSGDPNVNPHFYNANQIYLWYCSSDTHSGNRSASDDTGGFAFKGKVILQTLVNDLARRYKQSFLSARQVLLLGFSAGAMGAVNNADFVGSLVKSFVPNVNYKTYIDSGWYFDVPFYNSPGTNRDAIKLMYTNFNIQYNEVCTSVYQKSGEQWRCAFPLYAYPFVQTPLFVAGHEYDSPFLGVPEPQNATQAEWVSNMRLLFLMQTQPLPNFFSPNCWCHGLVAFDLRWNAITVQGTTASTMVWEWLNNNGGPKSVSDTCAAINCNPTCSCIYNSNVNPRKFIDLFM